LELMELTFANTLYNDNNISRTNELVAG
jgi:hypothetical protein